MRVEVPPWSSHAPLGTSCWFTLTPGLLEAAYYAVDDACRRGTGSMPKASAVTHVGYAVERMRSLGDVTYTTGEGAPDLSIVGLVEEMVEVGLLHYEHVEGNKTFTGLDVTRVAPAPDIDLDHHAMFAAICLRVEARVRP